MRIATRIVVVRPSIYLTLLTHQRLLVAILGNILIYPLLWRLQWRMWEWCGPHQEERLVLICADKLNHIVVHHIWCKDLVLAVLVIACNIVWISTLVESCSWMDNLLAVIDILLLTILPHISRIVIMRHSLTHTAVVEVKSRIPRCRAALRATNSPLADHTSCISRLLHHRAKCRCARLKAHLTLNAWVVVHHIEVPDTILNSALYILTNLRVTHILTRNQTATRWRRYWRSGVHICKADATICQRIDIRSLSLCLTIATKVAIARIVHKNKYHIGSILLLIIRTTCSHHRCRSHSRNNSANSRFR